MDLAEVREQCTIKKVAHINTIKKEGITDGN
jgi:hypothetical protein